MTHEEKAGELFRSGYTCAQSVLLAFSDVTGLDEKIATSISLSFGGGMGRLREVCGAVSGAFMVAGLLWGEDSGAPLQNKKAEHYALIQDIAARLREKNGSIICRELLGLGKGASAPVPEERTADYYKRRPCEAYICIAAAVIDDIIKERGVGRGNIPEE